MTQSASLLLTQESQVPLVSPGRWVIEVSPGCLRSVECAQSSVAGRTAVMPRQSLSDSGTARAMGGEHLAPEERKDEIL